MTVLRKRIEVLEKCKTVIGESRAVVPDLCGPRDWGSWEHLVPEVGLRR